MNYMFDITSRYNSHNLVFIYTTYIIHSDYIRYAHVSISGIVTQIIPSFRYDILYDIDMGVS